MKTWMCALMLALSTGASAQNPIISGQYSADPTARVFRLTVILRCKARVLVLNIWIKTIVLPDGRLSFLNRILPLYIIRWISVMRKWRKSPFVPSLQRAVCS